MSNDDQYEKERQEKLECIATGKEDKNGRKVYKVFTKSDEFAIYSTTKSCSINDIAIYIGTKNPDDRVPIDNLQSIKCDFDKLKSISNKTGETSYSSRVANALAIAIYGDIEKARSILHEITKEIPSATGSVY